MSIVEAYIDTVSEALFDRRVASLDVFFRNLTEAIQEAATSTWNERKSCFEVHHGFKIQECSGWDNFDLAVEVRNSIAHGLGVLTKKQLGANKQKKIRQARVRLTDGRIEVTKDSLRLCTDASIALIESIDEKLPRP